MRRKIFVFLLVVMVMVVLGGVAQAEKVKLRWMFHDSGPAIEKAVAAIYEKFIKINPDIEISIEYVPWEVAMQTVMTMVKGNTLPDMGRVWPVDELGKMGALVPLEDLLTPEDLKHYTPAMKEALSAEDPSGKTHLFAMSNYQGSYALLVNNTLLKEAGLTTDDLATYDSFEATLKKLKKDTNGDGIVDRWGWTWSGSGSQNPWTSMELAIYAFGGRLIKNLHMNSNVPEPVIIDSPETVKALTWMTNVYKNGLVPQSVPTDTYELSMEQFMTGQVATLQEGPWSLSS
ncbi:MAG: extracellular solute-binding protein, partial [Atribacterota bacterium]